MIIEVRVLGRSLVRFEVGGTDPDNGTDPGDATATIPALETE